MVLPPSPKEEDNDTRRQRPPMRRRRPPPPPPSGRQRRLPPSSSRRPPLRQKRFPPPSPSRRPPPRQRRDRKKENKPRKPQVGIVRAVQPITDSILFDGFSSSSSTEKEAEFDLPVKELVETPPPPMLLHQVPDFPPGYLVGNIVWPDEIRPSWWEL